METKIEEKQGRFQLSDTFYAKYGKRILDVIIALCGLLVLSPIILFVYVATYLDVGSPVLFRQKRIGKGGKIFVIYKFRNMNNNKDENGILLPPDQRVTKFGKLVRKTSLDELPQLINILKGDMSVIGPRPLLPMYLERYTEHDAHRHDIRPGLECPYMKPLDHAPSWEEQFANDVWYVENCSLKVDIILFFRLVQAVLRPAKGRGGADRGSYREAEFGPIRDYSGVNL